jgi:hypothetical protein
VTPCVLVERYQRFGGLFCFHLLPLSNSEDGGNRFLQNVDTYQTTRNHIPRDPNLNIHSRGNRKAQEPDDRAKPYSLMKQHTPHVRDCQWGINAKLKSSVSVNTLDQGSGNQGKLLQMG